ncbi:HeH/LEM domain-containing protein [Pseudomonas panipatensis]|uniref:HeH/LEM domain-containing protein n=2 Tax=Pseudomonas panipatensis TaxID=428992 RepID=A0A1G8HKC3_9PSED|nr:HeH/LEM domain-containing protein [Pseudomonas panipatensis]SMP58853.1 HeH/LEM domain-containing protein [Pseudomonas panipatensis]
MPMILVEKSFPFSPDGNEVITVEVGEQDVSERCALVAVEHLKVATLVDGVRTEVDPLKMKVPDLKAWLTAKGVAFDSTANKEALLALVPKDD